MSSIPAPDLAEDCLLESSELVWSAHCKAFLCLNSALVMTLTKKCSLHIVLAGTLTFLNLVSMPKHILTFQAAEAFKADAICWESLSDLALSWHLLSRLRNVYAVALPRSDSAVQHRPACLSKLSLCCLLKIMLVLVMRSSKFQGKLTGCAVVLLVWSARLFCTTHRRRPAVRLRRPPISRPSCAQLFGRQITILTQCQNLSR